MKNIYVELVGGKKVFMGKHSARVIKDATRIYKMIAKAIDPEDETNDAPNLYMMEGDELDSVVNTVCGWYDGLTYDDLMDGIQPSALMGFICDSCTFLKDGTIGRLDFLGENMAAVKEIEEK
jgi:hypothetical protein